MSGKSFAMYVGSYSPAAEAGIHLFRMDGETGALERIGGSAGVENPAFLAVTGEGKLVFSVSETFNGAVASLRVEEDGSLHELSRQPSHGDHPCYAMVDATGRWLLLVNYSSGNVLVYPIDDHGRIGPHSEQVRHVGRSVDENRQKSPHPHSIYPVPESDLWLVADLGTDAIYAYRLDAERGTLTPTGQAKAAPGAGPRHIAVHPKQPFVYVADEMSSTVSAYALNRADGTLAHLQTIFALPHDVAGNTCAEIAISHDGTRVYASNRGHDSIVTYRVGDDGRLELLCHTPSGGKTPRHFALTPDGRFLVVANQDSDSLAVFRLNEDGVPVPTGTSARVTQPSCVKFAAVPVRA